MDASVIVVGDEILSGHVQDANTHFIAARIAHHGHRLRRASVVGDEPGAIAAELRRDLDAGIGIVFVCGGLGPTHDDRTMEGVAAGLGAPLAPCPPLAARIEELVAYTARHGFTSDAFGVEGLRKMALAPEGAQVLPCSIGIVPAVVVDGATAPVVILPGPPRELQAVFLESVESRFLEGTGAEIWREEITHPFPESTLAQTLAELQSRYPDTSIGSYPQRDHVVVRIAGPTAPARAAAEGVRARVDELSASPDGKKLLALIRERRTSRD